MFGQCFFFVPHKFTQIQEDYEEDKTVIYGASPSEGLMKFFFPYSKQETTKQEHYEHYNNAWHKFT